MKKGVLSFKVRMKVVDKKAKDFKDLWIEDQKRFLYEYLDKKPFYINSSEIDDEEYGVNKEDKKLNGGFYGK